MCDAGRLSYRELQGEGRLMRPLVRGEDEFLGSTWASALTATAGRLGDLARAHGPGAVGMLVSAHSPNEEIYLLRRIGAHLGARLAGIAWSPPGAFADDFLIKADKNPNTEGLRLQGLPPDGEADALLEAAARGELHALVVHRADLTAWRDRAGVSAALERVRCLVVLDTEQRESTQFADIVFPLATYAESDGTFTNHAGRVQRFRAAVQPPGEARPGWLGLAELLAALTGERAFASAATVFEALVGECPSLAGVGYEALGEQGRPAAGARARGGDSRPG